MDNKPLIFDLDLIELTSLLDSWGFPAYRADQIWHGLYKDLYSFADQFSVLPRILRKQLSEYFGKLMTDGSLSFSALEAATIQESKDGSTRKSLYRLSDGRFVEAVLMQYARRRTLCISTQSGCAMGCVFCATGQMGFGRHLSSGEIVEQVLFDARLLAKRKESVSNVVIMGMGEPFHNYDATLAAIDRLNHSQGYNLGARRFTVSTVGLVPMIRRFAAEKRQVNLAISLHAADDELRSSMLPINNRYPLEELMSACRDYVVQTKRRITFEWALIEGVNDTPEQALKLAALLQTLRVNRILLCHVNAIPLNPTKKYAGKATSQARADIFKAELQKHSIPCTIRVRRGIDIQAGCGQLAGN